MNRGTRAFFCSLAAVGFVTASCDLKSSAIIENARLYGTVTGADGNPVGGAVVEAVVAGKVEKKTTTLDKDDPNTPANETGTYQIEGAPGGDVRIRFSKSGLAAKAFEMTLAQKNVKLDTTLVTSDAKLTVKVFGPEGALANARVLLSHPNYDLATAQAATPATPATPSTAPRRMSVRSATSGTDGMATFDSLPADDGFSVVVADMDSDKNGEYELDGGKKTANLSKNSPDPSTSLTFYLDRRLTYAGTLNVLVYGADKALETAVVTLVNKNQGLTVQAKTDKDGKAAFSNLPTTDGYEIYVSPVDLDADGEPDFEAGRYPLEIADLASSMSTFALNTYTDQTIKIRLNTPGTFRVLYTSVGSDGIIASGDSIEILFSHEVTKESVDEPNVDIFLGVDADRSGSVSCFPSTQSECVAFTSSLDDTKPGTGTKLTIKFVEKPKEGFEYRLDLGNEGRIVSTSGQSLSTAPISLTFSVRAKSDKPTSAPTLSLCGVAGGTCDTPSASAIDYNTTPDFQWAAVSGAVQYRLYAKNTGNVSEWVRLASYTPRNSPIEYATNVDPPSVFDLYGALGAFAPSHFAGGLKVTFTLTAVNSDGIEGDIDSTKVLTLSDTVAPSSLGTIAAGSGQAVVTGQDGSKVCNFVTGVTVDPANTTCDQAAEGRSANNTNKSTVGGATPSDTKKIHVVIRSFAEPMSGSPAITVIEEGATGCTNVPVGTAANMETLTSPSWVAGPAGMEGYMEISVAANRDNSGDCLLLKFNGMTDSSGNAETVYTSSTNPTPAAGSLVCSGDICIYQLE